MLKIMLADDHDVVRQGIRKILETKGDWKVCGEASNGREAVEMARKVKPDIAVIDLSMPELNGLDATRSRDHAETSASFDRRPCPLRNPK